ncbi:MAG: tape measure protein, partial [candidate division WOR-3 bacterium]
MTTSLTLPIAAFGAKAVQAAGDIEALRLALETTFKSAGRSVEEARKELEALRIVALQPGIDFEQAVRGSIRLQNVGYSAEAARAILVELANAIALTGGSAIELDGVTRQFAQVIAKGRILQEDLTIIQENMPAIGQALKNAFGTSSAERLRELGVTTEQLISTVIIELNKLPRVQGGIKNAIVNFFATLKIELAAFGDAINRAVNIEEAGNRILDVLKSIRKGFESLPEGAQKFVVYLAAGLAVIGPVIKVIGGIALTFGRLIDVVKLFSSFSVGAFTRVIQVATFFQSVILSVAKSFAATQIGAAIISSLQSAYLSALAGVTAFAQGLRASVAALFQATAAAYGFRTAVIAATFGVAAIIAGIVSAIVAIASAFNTASKSQEVFKDGQKQII